MPTTLPRWVAVCKRQYEHFHRTASAVAITLLSTCSGHLLIGYSLQTGFLVLDRSM